MSGLRLKLIAAPPGRIDLGGLTPSKLAGKSAGEVARLVLPSTVHGTLAVGDVFDVSGDMEGDGAVTFSGTTSACDAIGDGLDGGAIVVEGDAGAFLARHMKAGRIDVSGNAGPSVGTGLAGGVVAVKGSAGDYVGGVAPGEKFGMSGGTVIVSGNIGERAGDRMRRGTIVVKGKTGSAAGSRMAGGTIWTEGGFGAGPGPLLRRGTLIGPSADRLLATFADCGRHDLGILQILNRYVAETLGSLAPKPITGRVRRFAGDLATIGKGEILLLS